MEKEEILKFYAELFYGVGDAFFDALDKGLNVDGFRAMILNIMDMASWAVKEYKGKEVK